MLSFAEVVLQIFAALCVKTLRSGSFGAWKHLLAVKSFEAGSSGNCNNLQAIPNEEP